MYPRISYSTLRKLEECPMQYRLHRLGERNPVPERWTIVGNAIHYAMEQAVIGAKAPEQIVQDAVRDFDRRMMESRTTLGWGPLERQENRDRVEAGAWRLLEQMDSTFGAFDRDQIKAEMRLFRFFPGWAIEGYLDLAVQENRWSVSEVWDVKTGTSHTPDQLVFYSVLVESYFGHPPLKVGFIEPLGRGVVEVMVTEDERREMRERIRHAVEVVARDEFETSGFPKKCSRCSSESFCPATDSARNFKIGT